MWTSFHSSGDCPKEDFYQLSKTLWQLKRPGPFFSAVSPVLGGGLATAPLPAMVSTGVYFCTQNTLHDGVIIPK